MASGFGFLSRLEFLQDWASVFMAGANPAVIHNLEKYRILMKVHYLSAIEGVEGDYLEFGVFTGSSLCHSIRCGRKMARFNASLGETTYYGFDSFDGFGELQSDEEHPFYTDANFKTSMEKVERRVRRVAGPIPFQLVAGFFCDSLKDGPGQYGIESSRIIFIDSDTYSSSRDALWFCIPTIQQGTFIILDDFYSYRGSERKGVARAFREFVAESGIQVRHVFTYGMGGAVYVVSG
jgi:hypothetical protein